MQRYSYFSFKNLMKFIGMILMLWVLWVILVLNGEELLGHGFKEFSMIFISILLMALPFMLLISFLSSCMQVFFPRNIISRIFFKDKSILQHNKQLSKISQVLEKTTYKFINIGRYLIFVALVYCYFYLYF